MHTAVQEASLFGTGVIYSYLGVLMDQLLDVPVNAPELLTRPPFAHSHARDRMTRTVGELSNALRKALFLACDLDGRSRGPGLGAVCAHVFRVDEE